MFNSLMHRDKAAFQKAQRFRIVSQGLAFAAFAGGFWFSQLPKNEKEMVEREEQERRLKNMELNGKE